MKDCYDEVKRHMEAALGDLAILCGDEVGPSDSSWQDVAGTAVVNLRVLATAIEKARLGKFRGPLVFPSPSEIINQEENER